MSNHTYMGITLLELVNKTCVGQIGAQVDQRVDRGWRVSLGVHPLSSPINLARRLLE